MTLSKERQDWLRGAYLDRIEEVARFVVDTMIFEANELPEFLRGRFDFLTELTAEERSYLENATAERIQGIIRQAAGPEMLKGMEPVRPRPTEYVVDLHRLSEIGRRIVEDTRTRSGREQELLIEFGFNLEDAAKGSCVKEEYLDRYVHDEVSGWKGVQPLSEDDRAFLRGYLRGLILDEYVRIRVRYEHLLADFGDGLEMMQELQRAAKCGDNDDQG